MRSGWSNTIRVLALNERVLILLWFKIVYYKACSIDFCICFQKHQPRFPQQVSEADARLLLTFNSFNMKNNNFFIILICSIFIFGSTGCERTDLQKSSPNDSVKIEPRGIDDCSECPNMDDCCCSLTYNGSSQVMLKICGTTDGDAITCQANQDGCETIDGLSHSEFTLNPDDRIELFCMLMVRGFYIANLTANTVNLQLTCQFGTISPQVLNISIPAFSRKYYQTNDECEVEECGT